MNHYELLEVNPKASAEVIRAAYKSLMQRYHPDKNPGNAAVAERAALVVRAYEVLSDPARRLAYDAELGAPKAVPPAWTADADLVALRGRGRRPGAVRDGRMFWIACLIVAVIFASWLAMRSLQKLPPGTAGPATAARAKIEAPAVPGEAGSATETNAKTGAGAAPRVVSRDLPAFATNLTVKLRNPARTWEETGRVLSIPALTLRVGTVDPEGAIRHLGNMREQIVSRLQEGLAESRYEDLLVPDAQAALAKRIVEMSNDAAGTLRTTGLPPGASGVPVGGADPAERYGVVEAVLPDGFVVR